MPDTPEPTRTGQVLERRIVTALSCCLLSCSGADAETGHRDFIEKATAILQVMGASVRPEGDGALAAQFGCRVMSETDAERAVLGAFDLLSAKMRDTRLGQCALRIGIASGLIWIKSPTAEDAEVEPPLSAISMQASALRDLAGTDRILVSEGTRDFIQGLFDYEEGEPILLRNFSEPIRAFAVIRPSGADNRFEALRSQRLRMFGRERELSLLSRLWARACDGVGQVALITGEQGIGKSRLAGEASHSFVPLPDARLRLFGSPNHVNSAFYPFARLIERLCLFDRKDSPDVKRQKLEEFLVARGCANKKHLALLSEFLGLTSGGNLLPDASAARRWRELLREAIVALIEVHAKSGPVLMIFEDLQWADPSSKDLIEALVRQCRAMPLLLIVTLRAEYRPPWAGESAVSEVVLPPLRPRDISAFVSLIAGGRDLPLSLRDHVAELTGGVPLFIEELIKVIRNSGFPLNADRRDPATLRAFMAALPVNIQAVLLARLNQAGEGKAIAQIASIFGHHFSHALVQGIAGLDAEALNSGLARLIDLGLILRRGTPPEADYLFKHALIRETAYLSIPTTERKALHLRAAASLKGLDKQDSTGPEEIAHHLTEGGENEEAGLYWLLAGCRAVSHSAHLEAIEMLKLGLKCLRKAAHSPARDRRQRLTLMLLGAALMAVHGYGSSDASDAFERAAQLIDETTPVPEKLHIMCGLWNVRHGRSELYAALSLAEKIFNLSEATGTGSTMAHCVMGQTLAAMGEFKRAQSHFLYVIGQYRDGDWDRDTVRFTTDEHVLSLSYMGRILWALGCPDQAQAAIDEALLRAHDGADAVSVAIAHAGRLFMASHRGDGREMAVKIEEAKAHCSRYGLHLFEHWVLFNRGVLLIEQGDVAAGIQQMNSAIASAEARQSRQFRVFQLARVADAHLRRGASRQALDIADSALLLARDTGEKWSEAGVRRVRAEALAALGRPREAIRAFEKALSVARKQGARMEELRVATAMARHASNARELAQARRILSTIYESFEEGRDLPDLRSAREQLALLDPAKD